MKCVTYQEQNEWINYEQYENAKKNLLEHTKSRVEQDMRLRKMVYASPQVQIESSGVYSEGIILFSICWKNQKDNELYIEKKMIHNQIIFKSFAKITRKECEQILAGELQWMKTSRKNLLKEFYNEVTINGIAPFYIQEVEKDVFGHIKESRTHDSIVFKKSIRQALGHNNKDFFSESLSMADYNNCDRVLMSYKRSIEIPSAVSNIIHIHNTNSTLAYSL